MSAADPGSVQSKPDLLLSRVIAGVLRNAQDGELPLSTWTLGMPQEALVTMISTCFPESAQLQSLPEHQYEAIRQTLPDGFTPLYELLIQHASTRLPPAHSDWLARAVAAGCFGERHLWEGIELPDRASIDILFEGYFPSLQQRNVQRLRWKRFLLSEATAHHEDDTALLQCRNCPELTLCFPDQNKASS